MLPGPDYIYKCPGCDNLLRNEIVMSSNTFGAKLYSDGKAVSPMLPEPIILTSCKKCNTMFWLSHLRTLGSIGWDTSENPEWENAEELELLDIPEYLNALKIGIAKNKKEEIFIREKIWWLYNDRIRNNRKLFLNENDELIYLENISKFIKLLNQSSILNKILSLFNLNNKKHTITLAELNRNLGNFEDCIRTLKNIDDKDLNSYKDKIIQECLTKNKFVVEMTSKSMHKKRNTLRIKKENN